MAPKKKGGKKGGKKNKNKPSWMSDEMYELSQNLPKLNEFWTGDVKESKSKEGQAPPPNIAKFQAGLFIWQLLFPNNKAAKTKRQESIKLGIMETSVKILHAGKPQEVTPALGILFSLIQDGELQRQALLDSKPLVFPLVLKHLEDESVGNRSVALSLFRALVTNSDSRTRIWRYLKQDYSWVPLFECLKLNELSQLGGRNAAYDAAAALESLCNSPEGDVSLVAYHQLMAAPEALSIIATVLKTRHAHPMAKASCVAVLNALMKRADAQLCETIMMELGALESIVRLYDHPVVSLPYKAAISACLLRFIMPDTLWRDSSALAASGKRGVINGMPAMADATEDPEVLGEGPMDPSAVPSSPPMNGGESGGKATASPPPPIAAHDTDAGALGPHRGLASDLVLLDDATRDRVLHRARIVANQGQAISALVRLCAGPDGPLPDLEAAAATAAAAAAAAAGEEAPAAADGGKKGKKKGSKKKGKKKGKLEPGMAETQAFSSAVLRLISLAEEWRGPIVKAGAVRYLLPLLDTKVASARWNARQALVNLSMDPNTLQTLLLYKVPDYVHYANIPASHFQRPFVSSAAAAGAEGGAAGSAAAPPTAAAATGPASSYQSKAGGGGAGGVRTSQSLATGGLGGERGGVGVGPDGPGGIGGSGPGVPTGGAKPPALK